jgi:type IV secretion system protein VirD4
MAGARASVKTDLVRHTLGFRRQLGETAIFDPVAVTGLARAQWTPLTGCEEWGHAQRTARRIAEAVRPGDGENTRFWAEFGAVYLAPLLLAAARSHLTIAAVARWVREFADPKTDAEVLAALEGAGDATEAASGYRGIGASDHRMRSSLAGTAIVALAGYGDPLVRDSSQRSDITPGWLLDGPNTLYLCAPEDEQERLEPLFVTLLGEIISEAYRRAAARGGPLQHPLLLVLDELANVAAIPNLHRLAATGAGQGIQLVSIVQDLAQLVQRYGRERARTIVNNHRARWIGAGTADPDTLDYVARILGEEEIRHVSTSTSAGDPTRTQRTESTQWRTLAPGNVLRERAYGTGVLIYGNLPPARLALRTWQDDRQLRARAEHLADEVTAA